MLQEQLVYNPTYDLPYCPICNSIREVHWEYGEFDVDEDGNVILENYFKCSTCDEVFRGKDE
jgi:hypothetical protein